MRTRVIAQGIEENELLRLAASAEGGRTREVDCDSGRIAIRHLGAYLLGRFFTEIYPEDTHVGAMSAFGHMGAFCGLLLPSKWDAGSTPARLPRDP